MKNHISVSKELITKVDRAIQTVSKFSNLKTPPTNCVPDNSVIPSKLIEVVVMDEDTVILNRDLMGNKAHQFFEGSEIGFMVGCDNMKGNKTTGNGRPKEVVI